jgi:hypothetical protein
MEKSEFIIIIKKTFARIPRLLSLKFFRKRFHGIFHIAAAKKAYYNTKYNKKIIMLKIVYYDEL